MTRLFRVEIMQIHALDRAKMPFLSYYALRSSQMREEEEGEEEEEEEEEEVEVDSSLLKRLTSSAATPRWGVAPS